MNNQGRNAEKQQDKHAQTGSQDNKNPSRGTNNDNDREKTHGQSTQNKPQGGQQGGSRDDKNMSTKKHD